MSHTRALSAPSRLLNQSAAARCSDHRPVDQVEEGQGWNFPRTVCLVLVVGLLAFARFGSAAEEPAAAATEARQVIQQAIEQASRAPGERAVTEGRSVAALPAADPAEPEGLRTARVSAEVAARQLEAKRLAQKSPGDALALLDDIAAGLESQPLSEDARSQLLRRIERTRLDIEEATGKRRAELAL